MTNHTIVSSSPFEEKLLIALLLLLGLKGIGKGALLSTGVLVILSVYSLIAHALFEVADSIHTIWMTSDSLTRLLLVVIAIYCVQKLFPYAISLHKKGVI